MERKKIHLTPREGEILKLLRQGVRTAEIASLLYVSKRTVDFHLSNAWAKFKAVSPGGFLNRKQVFALMDELEIVVGRAIPGESTD